MRFDEINFPGLRLLRGCYVDHAVDSGELGGFGGRMPGGAERDVQGGGAGWHLDLIDGCGLFGSEEPPGERRLCDVVAGVV